MALLTKEQLFEILQDFYKESFGQRDSDLIYEQTAVNVLAFKREGRVYLLKSHPITGKVTVSVENQK